MDFTFGKVFRLNRLPGLRSVYRKGRRFYRQIAEGGRWKLYLGQLLKYNGRG